MALWYLLRGPYGRWVVIAGGGEFTHLVIGGPPPEEMIQERDGRFFLRTGFESRQGQAEEKLLPINEVFWNLILFLFLLGALPLRRWRERWAWILGASAAMVASHIVYFAVALTFQVGQLYHGRGLGEEFLSAGAVRALGYATTIWSVAFTPLLPLLALVPVLLPRREKPAPLARKPEHARPNDPCPCGSGRKYKRCCGAAPKV